VSGWGEVASGNEVAAALGMDRLIEGDEPVGLLSALMVAPDSQLWLRARSDDGGGKPGQMDWVVPRTRFFLNVTECRRFWGDAATAAIVYYASHSVPLTIITGSVRKLVNNLKRLTPAEAELVRIIFAAAPGNPYRESVPEADVRRAYRKYRDPIDDLLDAIEKKGVIEKRRGGRIQLVR
jgi:hypothetical protein